MSSLISIVIPIYNLEAYLAPCLSSIQNQTYTNWEAICVNDGSSDRSGEVVRRFAADDPRFRYVEQKNGGVSAARNAGLSLVKGEYVCFVDGDDLLHKQFLEFAMQSIGDYDLIAADLKRVYSQQIDMPDLACPPCRALDFATFYHLRDGLDANQIGKSACCKLYRKAFACTYLFPEGVSHNEDMCYLGMVLSLHPRIGLLDIPMYFYYERASSATHDAFSPAYYSSVEAFDVLCGFLRDKNDPYLSGHAMQTLFINIFRTRSDSIGTPYKKQTFRDCNRLGRKWFAAFLRNPTVPLKTRLLFSAFFFSNRCYEFARIHVDPTMKQYYRDKRKKNRS